MMFWKKIMYNNLNWTFQTFNILQRFEMQKNCVYILIRFLSVTALLLGGLTLLPQPVKGATTYTVDTLIDELDFNCSDGDCSLRDAISQSSPGDTIDFSVTGTITLTNVYKSLSIYKNLIIKGPGAGVLTISGQDSFRVFHVGNTTATISDLTVRDGGIYNSGSLTLTQLIVTDSQMEVEGAGIYNNGTIVMQNCTVSNNQIIAVSGVGGGIYNRSNMTIDGSAIQWNAAIQDGGGIYNIGALVVTNSQVNENQGRYGGGLYNNKTMRLTNITIRGNHGRYGGGINNDVTGDVTLINSDVSDNEATHNAGGIRNRSIFTITNTTLYSNTASAGGGIYNLTEGKSDVMSSTLSHNIANGHAGGIYNMGAMTITESIVSDNEAKGDLKIGGGIWNAGGSLTLLNSTVSGNVASGNGGGIYTEAPLSARDVTISGNVTRQHGGGIYQKTATLHLDNLTIVGNSVEGEVGNGGGIAIKDGTLEITNTLIQGNATSQDGGGIHNTGILIITESDVYDNQGRYGGGLYNNNTMHLTNVTLQGNGGQYGGGINNDELGDVTLKDSNVLNNDATENGGGVRNHGTFIVTNSTLYTNTATTGGGIYNLAEGRLDVLSGTLSYNTANGPAGGIYNMGTMTITGSTISGNEAKGELKNGGGIWNAGGSLTLTRSTISDNVASGNGGGIYTEANLNAINVTISGNVTDQHGGGIYLRDDTLRLENLTIVNNSISGDIGTGGGIAVRYGTLVIKNTLIGDNVAAKGDVDCFTWSGSFDDHGYNLVENPHESCVFEHVKDITGQPPKVDVLADNGGATWTHALKSGSAAINHGDCVDIAGFTVLVDQRGVVRPQGYTCDIGAYESSLGYSLYLPLLLSR
jgi:fibronectin-binding autotransporter adhesin